MLYAYGLMISGLFVPTVAGFALRRRSAAAAMASMLVGATVYLTCEQVDTQGWNANFFGILASLISFTMVECFVRRQATTQ